MKIKSISKINKHLKVYDFTVDDVHHYVLNNGIISHNSYVPTKELGGGTGLKYAASTIAMLSKRKEKDGTEVIGNIIKVKMYKSRLSKENQTVEVLLTYDKGLDRYYGLLELAEKYRIFNKVSTRYELPDGSKVFGKEINNNPTKYYTEEVLAKLEEVARKEFSYGTTSTPELEEDNG